MRRRMAQALRISDSALRNRAQRLRDRLERSVRGCPRCVPPAVSGRHVSGSFVTR